MSFLLLCFPFFFLPTPKKKKCLKCLNQKFVSEGGGNSKRDMSHTHAHKVNRIGLKYGISEAGHT